MNHRHATRRFFSAACIAMLSVFAQTSRGADATINWSDVKQEIDGFGACSNYRYADNTTMAMPADTQQAFFDFLFDSARGIGLSTLRIMTPEDHEPSKGVWNFTTVGTKNCSIMQEAWKRGV
jgi:O-glycosyl hydrolase